jgi:hypothetical protein
MEGDVYCSFRAAAVQVAPVFLDREASEESDAKRALYNQSQSVSEALFASSDSIL